MNTANPAPPHASSAKTRPRAVRGSHQARQLQLEQVSPEARKKAAVVLEVLAGLRTPLQAAECWVWPCQAITTWNSGPCRA